MVLVKLIILTLTTLAAGFFGFELNKINKYKFIYNEGVEALTKEDYKYAYKCFKDVYSVKPSMFENLYNLAYTYFQLHKFDEALRFFLLAYEKDPEDVDTIYNVGLMNYVLKNNRNTVKYFEKALSLIGEKDEQTILSMGIVYSELQDYDSSIKALEKLVELCPDNLEYRMLLADVYEKLIADTGNIACLDFVIQLYQEILKVDENNEPANVKLANAFAQRGDIDACQEACERAISQNPESADALNLLGVINFFMQNYQEAINYFEQVCALKPNMKSAYIRSAYAYAKLGSTEKALALFNTYKSKVPAEDISEETDKFFTELMVS